jgi:HemK-related putative methylase
MSVVTPAKSKRKVPLALDSKGIIRNAKIKLSTLHWRNREVFRKLFLEEEAVEKNSSYDVFEAVGLVSGGADGTRARVRIYPVADKFVVTDFPSLKEHDRVFPIYLDESAFLAENLAVQENDVALDLCTGSGILAIFAASKATRVYATDVNEKALHYARFNAVLNEVEDKIEFLRGDLYAPIGDRKFDFIVANPPFVPTPRGTVHYIHSAGGLTGLDIAKKVLIGLDEHLNTNGRFQMVTLSLGDEKGPTDITDSISRQFANRPWKVTIQLLYREGLKIQPSFLSLFADQPGYREWCMHLKSKGFTHQYYLLINMKRNSRFSLEINHSSPRFAVTYYSGGWESRLRRFSLPARVNGIE